jgi:hypothetical protein
MKGCTTVVGNLHIVGLPASVFGGILADNLASLRVIRGSLHMTDNMFIASMEFMSNIEVLYGARYSNNPSLVDARMPMLMELRGEVSVEGCDRLCPSRYTALGAGSTNEIECANVTLNYFMHIEGSFQSSDIGVFSSVFGRMLRNVTVEEV